MAAPQLTSVTTPIAAAAPLDKTMPSALTAICSSAWFA